MLRVTALGAGQDVGRSCVVVQGGRLNRIVMFDCGMHTGTVDESQRFPDFSRLPGAAQGRPRSSVVDLLIITHFHLDHCGALAQFTERYGYSGPILMTPPTRAIVPALLEDARRVADRRRNNGPSYGSARANDDGGSFSLEDVPAAMAKVRTVRTREMIKVCEGLEVRVWYGSHVLGAGVWEVRFDEGQCVVYTGDYNTTADRHLGGAWVPRVCPDLLISESTYCTVVRESKRARERKFLQLVHSTVAAGGKVLIPAFAMGRAQELMVLLDAHWDRLGLTVPLCYAQGLTSKALTQYSRFVGWMNQSIKETFADHNRFELRHFTKLDSPGGAAHSEIIKGPGPAVLFATPGMLHAGMSLEVFLQWAGSEKNAVIFPGYCAPDTIGGQLIGGVKEIETADEKKISVRCKIDSVSFSAHVDAKGILQLIQSTGAKEVMLVHGEPPKMAVMSSAISRSLGIPCHVPENFEELVISAQLPSVPVSLSSSLLMSGSAQGTKRSPAIRGESPTHAKRRRGPGEVSSPSSVVVPSSSPSLPGPDILNCVALFDIRKKTLSMVGKDEVGAAVGGTLSVPHIIEYEMPLDNPRGIALSPESLRAHVPALQKLLRKELGIDVELLTEEHSSGTSSWSLKCRSVVLRHQYGKGWPRVTWTHQDEAVSLRLRKLAASFLGATSLQSSSSPPPSAFKIE